MWSPTSSSSSRPGGRSESQSDKEGHEASREPLSPWPWLWQLEPVLSSAWWGHLQRLWDALSRYRLSSSNPAAGGGGQVTDNPSGGQGQEEEVERRREHWVAATVGVWMALLLLVSSLSLGRRNQPRATQ